MAMQPGLDLIKTLLLHEWDPIGVFGCEGAEDEYDRYALRVFEMLRKGADADAIARYLTYVVTSAMLLRGNPEEDRLIAAKAVAIRESEPTIQMTIIELDASEWNTSGDFLSALKVAIGAPDWHGLSVNAFVDSIGTGGINAVEPPYVVRVVNARRLGQDVIELIVAISSAVEKRRLYEAARTGEDAVLRLEITD
jgi:hypothetical protein